MIILDESVPENQRERLREWRIAVRHLGYEIERKGIKDDEIIPFLLQQRRPTFVTLDGDFYKRRLCHPRYCLVYLEAQPSRAAALLHSLIRLRELDTESKRMGKVIRVSEAGISIWKLHAEKEERIAWE